MRVNLLWQACSEHSTLAHALDAAMACPVLYCRTLQMKLLLMGVSSAVVDLSSSLQIEYDYAALTQDGRLAVRAALKVRTCL